MKRYVSLGAALCLAAGVVGCSGDDPASPVAGPAPVPATATFDVTDEAGHWFDSGGSVGPTRSLAIVKPGDKVAFLQTKSKYGPSGQSRVESFHTVTSLIWPADATPAERIDQDKANKDDHEVTLNAKGLYVFVCKLHPYMLAGVIVNDEKTEGLDIGEQLHLLGVTHAAGVKEAADAAKAFPSKSDLGLRLLRAFFVVTSPSNWKNYAQPAGTIYKPDYPDADVRVTGGAVVNLKKTLQDSFDIDDKIPALKTPATDGIGEVWVDTQYEVSKTKGVAYPSTVTVVDVAGPNKWKVKRKIALHDQKMNNAHNLWASHDQNQIYNTEWQGNSLYVMNHDSGALIQELDLVNGPEVTSKGIKCHDPAHVMTRVDTQQVHTGCNGDDGVVELDRLQDGKLGINRLISMQDPSKPSNQTQPHAHWMGHDGQTMVTPNSNSNDSTLFDFPNNKVKAKPETGTLPIASGINPDSTKYYVSNYLGHSISVIDMASGKKSKDINLLQNYDPATGPKGGAIGGLPIQTPVSPDGKFVITGNTLTGTITIIDAKTDTLVKSIACDPGCHGVNFGAKKGGGYYAYVTSKFSNRLIVFDYDKNNDGNVDDAEIAGWVVLADANAPIDDPGGVSGNPGMGGQGLLPVPNVYNGWVQKLPKAFCDELSPAQRNPIGAPVNTCPES